MHILFTYPKNTNLLLVEINEKQEIPTLSSTHPITRLAKQDHISSHSMCRTDGVFFHCAPCVPYPHHTHCHHISPSVYFSRHIVVIGTIRTTHYILRLKTFMFDQFFFVLSSLLHAAFLMGKCKISVFNIWKNCDELLITQSALRAMRTNGNLILERFVLVRSFFPLKFIIPPICFRPFRQGVKYWVYC